VALGPLALDILIAEDDPTLREALAGFLRRRGHRVTVARHGGEALAALEHQDFSLVITDLIMPVADGLEVLRAARRREPPPLVLLMTGYASIDSAIQAIREGAYDYLRKPFKLQEIEVAVANASRLLALYQENQTLLRRLEDLSARLTGLSPEGLTQSGASPAPATPEAPASAPRDPDLKRLRLLYQERLLSEPEYHTLRHKV
jgi:DNA-binding NtrC family response regulator